MNTPTNLRLAAAIAAMTITFSILFAVDALAQPPVAGSLLALSTTVTVR